MTLPIKNRCAICLKEGYVEMKWYTIKVGLLQRTTGKAVYVGLLTVCDNDRCFVIGMRCVRAHSFFSWDSVSHSVASARYIHYNLINELRDL